MRIVYAGSTGYYSCGSFNITQLGKGIQVSTDRGQTWSNANDTNTQDAAVSQIAVHPNDPLTVYAATFNKGLLKTQDGGKYWALVKPVNNPNIFSGVPIGVVRISPVKSDLIFSARMGGGLVRSEDGGSTWTIAASGLNPQATVSDLEFDVTDPRVIYLSDLFSGVYRSSDTGKTWKAINQNLLVRAVNALALSADGQHLYAATEGRGVFRLDLNGAAPIPISQPTPVSPPVSPPQQPTTAEPPVSPPQPALTPLPTGPIQEPGASPVPEILPVLEPTDPGDASPTNLPLHTPIPTVGNPLLNLPLCKGSVPLLMMLTWAMLSQKRWNREKKDR